MYKITKADKIETNKMIKEFKIKRERLIKLQALMMKSIAENLSMKDTLKQGEEFLEMGYSVEEMNQTLDKIRGGKKW